MTWILILIQLMSKDGLWLWHELSMLIRYMLFWLSALMMRRYDMLMQVCVVERCYFQMIKGIP